jgi:hypothetical protein
MKLPPIANKTNVDTVVSICLFQNYCCVDCPIIYLSYDTQQDAFHKRCDCDLYELMSYCIILFDVHGPGNFLFLKI